MKIVVRIMFVCHGNICRSTMAEFVMKDLVKKAELEEFIKIDSTATNRDEIGNDTHYGTKEKLTEVGITFTKRKARQITIKDYDESDYIIIMDENNRNNLMKIIGEDSENKVIKALNLVGETRDVKDPWYTGNFDETYDDVLAVCQALLIKVKNEI